MIPLLNFSFVLLPSPAVQHLTSNHLDPVARVTICTIQRLYAMLRAFLIGMKHGCRKTGSREETGHALCEFNEACGMAFGSALAS
ncbi:hypothetical protein BH20VER1_BH20VER1_00610 [soil metagenome]